MRFDLGRSCGAFFLWPFVCSLRVRSPLIPLQIGEQAIYNDIQLEIFNDIHTIYRERDDYNRRNHILYIHDIYMIYPAVLQVFDVVAPAQCIVAAVSTSRTSRCRVGCNGTAVGCGPGFCWGLVAS